MNINLKLNIDKRELFAGGMTFADVGPYERIMGRIIYYIKDPHLVHPRIADLEKAERNLQGQIEFSANFFILKPLNMKKGNRRLFYHVVNRGRPLVLRTFNDAPQANEPATPAHAGNGYLMRKGYTIAWSGWQGDLLPGQGKYMMDVPIATDNGLPLVDKVMAEFIADSSGIYSFPLSGNNVCRSYEAASLDTVQSVFTCRQYEADPRKPVPSSQWQFARAGKDDLSGKWHPVPSSTDCFLSGGFQPGWIYELVYPAKNPLVMGLGFTGVSEFVSFLRYAETDISGTRNPLKEEDDGIEKVYSWGASQSGRFLRDFLYQGFNADQDGRRVFGAIFPHSAGAGRIFLNYRFAQPGRHSCQHEDHLYPSDLFPFSYARLTDPLTGRTDALLKRPETDPLVIETQNPVDYWQRRASLVHTDSEGHDVAPPENSRVYLMASISTHPLGEEEEGICKYHPHILSKSPNAIFRALLSLLDRWASNGAPPPPSRVPRRADGSMVSASQVHNTFPLIPGVSCPREPDRMPLLDYGPGIDRGIISIYPPHLIRGKEYSVLVPSVDSDGNDIPGIKAPEILAPVATYTGWNIRVGGYSPGALAKLMGSYFPFPRTERERKASGDPRPSVQERYRSLEGYVRAVAQAVETLVKEGFLLDEDASLFLDAAKNTNLFD